MGIPTFTWNTPAQKCAAMEREHLTEMMLTPLTDIVNQKIISRWFSAFSLQFIASRLAYKKGRIMQRFIAYYRVSTARQGQSGLGLEAQKQLALNHLHHADGAIIEEFVEVESGKSNDRPKLHDAIAACKRQKAKLLIAKLDRLSRNVAFIASLMESNVQFVCCDNPHANPLMLHIMAAFAEHEREMISKRTKEALAQAKARGVVLGRYGKEVLSVQNREQAMIFAESLRPAIERITADGYVSVRQIRDRLNEMELPTSSGASKWQVASVHRVLKRIAWLKSQPPITKTS